VNNAGKNVELLAPAKNSAIGIAAINNGADAVYIGAPQFGARIAASNSIADIESIVRYAHLFHTRVYVTLNTILFDKEIEHAVKLIRDLYNIGIDGLIIQDMGLLEFDIPPVPLIASTQTHNTTPEKVLFLENVGFKRVILARECTLSQIQSIRSKTSVELEFFIHGSLCVSYSGQCYMSQAFCQRSSNRGECAQPCRLSYDLSDSKGNVLVKDKYLLSLRDLNLSTYIENLLMAGITSFKIEGRLKDITYVKNVTAFYRQIIDRILLGKPGNSKKSSGKIIFNFTPDPEKSFNRGFTNYNIEGRKEKISSFVTQKSLGKSIGTITGLGSNWFKMNKAVLNNGDGICYFDNNQNLLGTNINKIDGGKIYPGSMEALQIGAEIFRNHDHQFEKYLQKSDSLRKIEVSLVIKAWTKGFELNAIDEDGYSASVQLTQNKDLAENIELAKNNMIKQLSKSGNSVFEIKEVKIETGQMYFISVSNLNQLRRDVLQLLENERLQNFPLEQIPRVFNEIPYYEKQITYTSNVLNSYAKRFYQRHGVIEIEDAFETLNDFSKKMVMTTKHCIRYQLDACPTYQGAKRHLNEPLFLKDRRHKYKLEFDCKCCIMKVIYDH
jgi:23S rRNA 5-hydroxycytidine C2501 synthase